MIIIFLNTANLPNTTASPFRPFGVGQTMPVNNGFARFPKNIQVFKLANGAIR